LTAGVPNIVFGRTVTYVIDDEFWITNELIELYFFGGVLPEIPKRYVCIFGQGMVDRNKCLVLVAESVISVLTWPLSLMIHGRIYCDHPIHPCTVPMREQPDEYPN
jgi:hypothetical protein